MSQRNLTKWACNGQEWDALHFRATQNWSSMFSNTANSVPRNTKDAIAPSYLTPKRLYSLDLQGVFWLVVNCQWHSLKTLFIFLGKNHPGVPHVGNIHVATPHDHHWSGSASCTWGAILCFGPWICTKRNRSFCFPPVKLNARQFCLTLRYWLWMSPRQSR